MDVLKTVAATITRQRLLTKGDAVLVGVSGGADSLALLAILRQLQPAWGLSLRVAHFNHRLRPAADADAAFVKGLCEQWGLPCDIIRLRISTRTPEASFEDLARDRRLAGLRRLVKKYRCDCVALGHQQDDCAETVLLHLLRGSGLQGLQGILPRREIDGLIVVRPLLEVRHADLCRYLTGQGLAHREDLSNQDPRYLRNRIRHQLLPLLAEDFQPRITPVLARLAQGAGQDMDFLSNQARQVLAALTSGRRPGVGCVKISLSAWAAQHPSMRRMTLRLAIQQVAGTLHRLTAGHIDDIESLCLGTRPTARLDLPGGLRVGRSRDTLTLQRKA